MQTLKLQTLPFGSAKTYLTAAIFLLGNIILPQIFHLVPQGGVTWLPIYFFTLVGAYMYGWRVGLLTALASPLINSLLFSMPAPAVLPAIMLKSALLALIAGLAAARYKKATLAILAAVVIGYQALGTLGEWTITGDLSIALQDLRIGIPGLLLQIFAGWALLKFLLRS